MKRLIAIAVLVMAACSLQAQTFGPPQIGAAGPIATSVTQCVVSAPHGFTLCPVETATGGTLYYSINGGAFVALGTSTIAGVTSLNGKTGNLTVAITPGSTTAAPITPSVTYTPPALSIQ